MKKFYLFILGIIFILPAQSQQIDPEISKAAENIENR
jgi:hypothetical protein